MLQTKCCKRPTSSIEIELSRDLWLLAHLNSLALCITYSGYWNLSIFNLFLHGTSCTKLCVLCALGLSDTIIVTKCFYFVNWLNSLTNRGCICWQVWRWKEVIVWEESWGGRHLGWEKNSSSRRRQLYGTWELEDGHSWITHEGRRKHTIQHRRIRGGVKEPISYIRAKDIICRCTYQ